MYNYFNMSNHESISPQEDFTTKPLTTEDSQAWLRAFYDGWCLRTLALVAAERLQTEGYDPEIATQRLFESTIGDTSRQSVSCFNNVCHALVRVDSLLEKAPAGCPVYFTERHDLDAIGE